jgi:TRAP transporter TAXI family solute receptor
MAPAAARDPAPPLTIATGGRAGAYFVAGQRLCQMVNRGRADHGIRCAAVTSAGSGENLAWLAAGRADLAIVQSDVVARFADRERLRFVMGLHAEQLTMVVRAGDAVTELAGLDGRRVDLAAEGSGVRDTGGRVLAALGARPADTPALPADQRAAALCGNRVDAVVLLQGHPSVAMLDMIARCPVRILAAPAAAIDHARSAVAGLEATAVPGGVYAIAPADVPTLGVKAVVVARADLTPAAVALLRRLARDRIDILRGADPALRGLDAAALDHNATGLRPAMATP